MKARLVTGEIITLPHDCSCRSHEGPHWLYVDDLERKRNEEAMQRIDDEVSAGPVEPVRKMKLAALIARYGDAEERRLRAKLRYMEALGIAELIPETED